MIGESPLALVLSAVINNQKNVGPSKTKDNVCTHQNLGVWFHPASAFPQPRVESRYLRRITCFVRSREVRRIFRRWVDARHEKVDHSIEQPLYGGSDHVTLIGHSTTWLPSCVCFGHVVKYRLENNCLEAPHFTWRRYLKSRESLQHTTVSPTHPLLHPPTSDSFFVVRHFVQVSHV